MKIGNVSKEQREAIDELRHVYFDELSPNEQTFIESIEHAVNLTEPQSSWLEAIFERQIRQDEEPPWWDDERD